MRQVGSGRVGAQHQPAAAGPAFQQHRPVVPVDGDDLGGDRPHGQERARVLVAAGAELQATSLRDRPEVAHESDDHLLLFDGVDESVGELMLDAEHRVEAGMPGAPLGPVPAG
jgi:hypothetical protein